MNGRGGKRLGIVFIKVNGTLLESMKGASLELGGEERTPVMGRGRLLGFTYETTPARCECKIAFGAQTDLLRLHSLEGATLTFECDTGQVFSVAGAASQSSPKITAGEPTDLVLIGNPAVEMGELLQ